MYTQVRFQNHIIDFNAPDACLPARALDGQVYWITWGLPRQEPHLHFPFGATAALSEVISNWGRLQPIPVVLPVRQFQARHRDGDLAWMTTPSNLTMRGVLAHWPDEMRAYNSKFIHPLLKWSCTGHIISTR